MKTCDYCHQDTSERHPQLTLPIGETGITFEFCDPICLMGWLLTHYDDLRKKP